VASPQCENGYTKIANELLEAISLKRIPGQELRIVFCIIRKTYGFGKKSDRISYGQIAKATGIPRVRVIMHIQALISKKILGSLNNGTRQPSTIWINKDYSQWIDSPIKGTSPNNGTKVVPKMRLLDSPNNGTHKRNNKETIQKKKNFIVLPDFISKDLWQDFKEHRNKLKGTMTKRAQELLIKKISDISKGKTEIAQALIEQSIENGWKGIFPLKDQLPKSKSISDIMAQDDGYKILT
ncbi:MAG: replication protein, partial [Nitrospirota bacterium]